MRLTPRLVAFTGPAGAGKSTAAQVLVVNCDLHLVEFVSPLKAMMRAFYDLAGMARAEADRRIEGNLKKERCPVPGVSLRYAMQTLGTEWGRDLIGPDLWVRIWGAAAGQHLAVGHKVVADDCRFPNEVAAIRALRDLWAAEPLVIALATLAGCSGIQAALAPPGTDYCPLMRQACDRFSLAYAQIGLAADEGIFERDEILRAKGIRADTWPVCLRDDPPTAASVALVSGAAVRMALLLTKAVR